MKKILLLLCLSAISAWLVCRFHFDYINNYSLFISFSSFGLSLFVLWIAHTVEKYVHKTANKNSIIKLRNKFVNIYMSDSVMDEKHIHHATSIIKNAIDNKTLPNSATKELQNCLKYLQSESPQYETFARHIDQAYEILIQL